MPLNLPTAKRSIQFWTNKNEKKQFKWERDFHRIYDEARNELRSVLGDKTLGSEHINTEFQSIPNKTNERPMTPKERAHAERAAASGRFGTFMKFNMACGFCKTIKVQNATAFKFPEPTEENPNPKLAKVGGGEQYEEKVPMLSLFFDPANAKLKDSFFNDPDVWRVILLPLSMRAMADVFTIRYLDNCYLDFYLSSALGTVQMIVLTPMTGNVEKIWAQSEEFAKELTETSSLPHAVLGQVQPSRKQLDFRGDMSGAIERSKEMLQLRDESKAEDFVEVKTYGTDEVTRISREMYEKLKEADKLDVA